MRRILVATLLALTGQTLFAQETAQPTPAQPFHDNIIQTYGGMAGMTTSPFKVNDGWELRWTSPMRSQIKLTLFNCADGSLINGAAGWGKGVMYLAKGGRYYLQIEVQNPTAPSPDTQQTSPNNGPMGNFPGMTNGSSNAPTMPSFPPTPWSVSVVEMVPGNTSLPSLAPANGNGSATAGIVYVPPTAASASSSSIQASSSSATPPAGNPPANGAPVSLSDSQTRAVVLIKGDNAEGTGFLVKLNGQPAVVTNLHVLSDNPNVQITTSSGIQIKAMGLKGAQDRDLALIPIQDGPYSYLDLSPDVGATAQSGDQVITPGNSEGGEVMLNTQGQVLAIGPQKVEINNPIYHGNSGGPILHVKSGKVLGVVTEAIKVDHSDELDKTSSQSSNSAITGTMRYFGLRLDNVPNWETYDWRRFQTETIFLDQFHDKSRCLDSFLNGSDASGNATSTDDPNFQKLYLSDEAIKTATETFDDQAGGADSSGRLDAMRGFMQELHNIADTNVDDIKNLGNFYSFDQQRAKDEMEYRKELEDELDSIDNNISRVSSLPRVNN